MWNTNIWFSFSTFRVPAASPSIVEQKRIPKKNESYSFSCSSINSNVLPLEAINSSPSFKILKWFKLPPRTNDSVNNLTPWESRTSSPPGAPGAAGTMSLKWSFNLSGAFLARSCNWLLRALFSWTNWPFLLLQFSTIASRTDPVPEPGFRPEESAWIFDSVTKGEKRDSFRDKESSAMEMFSLPLRRTRGREDSISEDFVRGDFLRNERFVERTSWGCRVSENVPTL